MNLNDVNNNVPEFVGVDNSGLYIAAVSAETRLGDEVIFISAIDLDGTSPNNLVSRNKFLITLISYFVKLLNSLIYLVSSKKKSN